MPNTRLPRFRRAGGLPPVTLTERDRAILTLVHRHRFLRSTHLVAVLGGSRQHLLRRLQRLYHHGYLERPRAQLDYFHTGGSQALVYGLGNRGAAYLKRSLKLPFPRLDWNRRNQDATRLFLEHTLQVADALVALEVACRQSGAPVFLAAEQLALPDATARSRTPFRWSVSLPGRRRCGVVPDGVFGLEFSTGDRRWFFLEADRATMPVKRQELAQSSCFRKLLAYEATWTQGLHRSRFGWARFRVLTLTSSAERVEHLAQASRELARGRGLFLFGERATFLADPLGSRLTNGHGRPEPLADPSGTVV